MTKDRLSAALSESREALFSEITGGSAVIRRKPLFFKKNLRSNLSLISTLPKQGVFPMKIIGTPRIGYTNILLSSMNFCAFPALL